MQSWDHYEDLYVASDLHLGGEGAYSIFTAAAPFLAFCRKIAGSGRRTGLVINGDLVDFLAEDKARYFDPAGAESKLDRIAKDPAFSPVFEGLATVAAAPAGRLIITIGNHDIELALPWVREKLLQLITKGDPVARANVTLALDGTGYRCRVGRARVVCIHGNDVDNWNVNDYEAIRRATRDATFGVPGKEWVPNAGTMLVVDVINQIKKDYAFVNLLKPEVRGVVPVVLAIEPQVEGLAAAATQVAAGLGRDLVRRWTGLLGDSTPEPVDPMLDAARILRETEERFEQGVDPYTLAEDAEAQLGLPGALVRWIRGDRRGAAREALERLAGDRSFDFTHEDDQARDLDNKVGSGADIVIAGHSHLERSHKRRAGGWYLNSGTWALLARLTESHWKDDSSFEQIWEAILRSSLDALRNAGVIAETRTVAAVREIQGKTVAELLRARTNGETTPVKGSQWEAV
jgi:UDP-2,3-diacylglucosamine pyrophosphatase LpxH